ncbi:hypothetical protein cyc_09104 [Cyclospora cayetanensis]|uniref:Uncharacterized protein n=1 Tax=Cyclospora cayetanensis TaxID=88456 RepID=A0A1D3D814_9EIME|nr:hypothetical protein cyc_09104 [Cyclospora cayetanensis]
MFHGGASHRELQNAEPNVPNDLHLQVASEAPIQSAIDALDCVSGESESAVERNQHVNAQTGDTETMNANELMVEEAKELEDEAALRERHAQKIEDIKEKEQTQHSKTMQNIEADLEEENRLLRNAEAKVQGESALTNSMKTSDADVARSPEYSESSERTIRPHEMETAEEIMGEDVVLEETEKRKRKKKAKKAKGHTPPDDETTNDSNDLTEGPSTSTQETEEEHPKDGPESGPVKALHDLESAIEQPFGGKEQQKDFIRSSAMTASQESSDKTFDSIPFLGSTTNVYDNTHSGQEGERYLEKSGRRVFATSYGADISDADENEEPIDGGQGNKGTNEAVGNLWRQSQSDKGKKL